VEFCAKKKLPRLAEGEEEADGTCWVWDRFCIRTPIDPGGCCGSSIPATRYGASGGVKMHQNWRGKNAWSF
jgi:hypothetical protein